MACLSGQFKDCESYLHTAIHTILSTDKDIKDSPVNKPTKNTKQERRTSRNKAKPKENEDLFGFEESDSDSDNDFIKGKELDSDDENSLDISEDLVASPKLKIKAIPVPDSFEHALNCTCQSCSDVVLHAVYIDFILLTASSLRKQKQLEESRKVLIQAIDQLKLCEKKYKRCIENEVLAKQKQTVHALLESDVHIGLCESLMALENYEMAQSEATQALEIINCDDVPGVKTWVFRKAWILYMESAMRLGLDKYELVDKPSVTDVSESFEKLNLDEDSKENEKLPVSKPKRQLFETPMVQKVNEMVTPAVPKTPHLFLSPSSTTSDEVKPAKKAPGPKAPRNTRTMKKTRLNIEPEEYDKMKDEDEKIIKKENKKENKKVKSSLNGPSVLISESSDSSPEFTISIDDRPKRSNCKTPLVAKAMNSTYTKTTSKKTTKIKATPELNSTYTKSTSKKSSQSKSASEKDSTVTISGSETSKPGIERRSKKTLCESINTPVQFGSLSKLGKNSAASVPSSRRVALDMLMCDENEDFTKPKRVAVTRTQSKSTKENQATSKGGRLKKSTSDSQVKDKGSKVSLTKVSSTASLRPDQEFDHDRKPKCSPTETCNFDCDESTIKVQKSYSRVRKKKTDVTRTEVVRACIYEDPLLNAEEAESILTNDGTSTSMKKQKSSSKIPRPSHTRPAPATCKSPTRVVQNSPTRATCKRPTGVTCKSPTRVTRKCPSRVTRLTRSTTAYVEEGRVVKERNDSLNISIENDIAESPDFDSSFNFGVLNGFNTEDVLLEDFRPSNVESPILYVEKVRKDSDTENSDIEIDNVEEVGSIDDSLEIVRAGSDEDDTVRIGRKTTRKNIKDVTKEKKKVTKSQNTDIQDGKNELAPPVKGNYFFKFIIKQTSSAKTNNNMFVRHFCQSL